jgi:ribulose-bisphosphate carboxylase large chain
VTLSSSYTLSGERFSVWYQLIGTETEALAKAKDICLEQTVEFPESLVPEGMIRDQILGRIESFGPTQIQPMLKPDPPPSFTAKISYAVETTGLELTQLLNVLFGNISIKPGIRVEKLELAPVIYQRFKGPRFGREGLRARLGIPRRPLLCTALKPMGLSAVELEELAYRFALGGIDMIKDDHGLADQPMAPFTERVERCVAGVERANRETGRKCCYVPNLSAPADRMIEKAYFAKQAGAGALLIAPGLTGFDIMRQIAEEDEIGIPIIHHPAFQGSYVIHPESGISHYALFGQLNRLAGADAAIFPNYGGRFSFSRFECQQIVAGTAVPMGSLREIFPAPGGGMTLERIPDMMEVYGREVIFLIGGGLHTHGPDLVENCRYFVRMVEGM